MRSSLHFKNEFLERATKTGEILGLHKPMMLETAEEGLWVADLVSNLFVKAVNRTNCLVSVPLLLYTLVVLRSCASCGARWRRSGLRNTRSCRLLCGFPAQTSIQPPVKFIRGPKQAPTTQGLR